MLDFHEVNKGDPGSRLRYVVSGIQAGAPTSASSQGAGAGGATAIRVNETGGFVRLPKPIYNPDVNPESARWGIDEVGVVAERAANADLVVASASAFLLATQERRVIRVAYALTDGTVAYANVNGAAAADGASVDPTDAEIATAIGSPYLPWEKLYRVKVRRTADTVVACTYDNLQRPLGVHGRGVINSSAL